jgi:hypothetical protein
MVRNELPLDLSHLGVPSSVPKMISMPVVHLVQIMHVGVLTPIPLRLDLGWLRSVGPAHDKDDARPSRSVRPYLVDSGALGWGCAYSFLGKQDGHHPRLHGRGIRSLVSPSAISPRPLVSTASPPLPWRRHRSDLRRPCLHRLRLSTALATALPP